MLIEKMNNEAGQLAFFGSETAELFTREITESMRASIEKNMITDESNDMAGNAGW